MLTPAFIALGLALAVPYAAHADYLSDVMAGRSDQLGRDSYDLHQNMEHAREQVRQQDIEDRIKALEEDSYLRSLRR
jgi:hypothetical protein